MMQENSCIKLSFIFLAGFAQACMYSLGFCPGGFCPDTHKHNVNFEVSSTCFNVDKKNAGGKQGVFSHEILETHKTMQSLLDVDSFLMLEVFALDTNITNIKLYKVSIF